MELGESSVLNGSYIPGTGAGTPLWSPKDSIENVNEFVTPFLPLKDKSYTLTVTDENGCTDTDVVEVRVKIVRPVFSPNIIQSGNEGTNGTFHLEGGRAVKSVKRLEVYDRWGNKLYEGKDLDIQNFDEGWKADFNGKKVNPGVYTWIAIVLFIDDVEIAFTGDVTVVE
ncbi:MAG: gliding motility-associated C-terminal domain-containing protein [Saprospiraceae bacterium]|nr:gliding motility-associated C-terminal domain-containing protein [Saprospiraceae bacterium]